MAESTVAFHAIRLLVRAIPEGMPGKLRLARLAMRPFGGMTPIRIPDRFGNMLWCPSINEPISTAVFACGVYEPDTIAAILDALPQGGTYVDVGANVGAIALPVASTRPDATIVCVEADPDIAAMLRLNVAENARWNVRVVETLAGAEANPAVAFYRAPAHKFGMGSIGPQFSRPPVALAQRPLDDILDELGYLDVDVVKLDIEGAELGALRGLARRLTGSRAPVVIFEFVDWAEDRIEGQAAGDAQKLLMSLGYRLLRLEARNPFNAVIQEPMTESAAMILAMPPKPSSQVFDG